MRPDRPYKRPAPTLDRIPGRRLLWDGETMDVTNDKKASGYAKREYRDGWTL